MVLSKREKYIGIGAIAAVALLGINSLIVGPYFEKAAALQDEQIAATKAKNLSGRGAYRAKHLILEKDGKVQREERVWTDDKLVDNNLGEARQMAVRTVGGKQYLLVEMGTYPEDATEDWKCGWQIYSKEP